MAARSSSWQSWICWTCRRYPESPPQNPSRRNKPGPGGRGIRWRCGGYGLRRTGDDGLRGARCPLPECRGNASVRPQRGWRGSSRPELRRTGRPWSWWDGNPECLMTSGRIRRQPTTDSGSPWTEGLGHSKSRCAGALRRWKCRRRQPRCRAGCGRWTGRPPALCRQLSRGSWTADGGSPSRFGR